MENAVLTDKCYCDIPRPRLAYLIQERFIRGVSTVELMNRMTTPEEREEVAVVALLDVPREELPGLLTLKEREKLPHWLECHKNIRLQLAEEGLFLRGVAA